jgi:hypothetical protein
MKKLLPLLCVVLFAMTLGAAQAQNTPLITQTVGTGSNVSYFVINFDDGPNNSNNPSSDYVFAYHWDSSAAPTGETMLTALNQLTNPTLQVNQTYYASFDAYFVNGFTYTDHSQTGYYNSSADQASWVYWVDDSGTWQQSGSGVNGRTLFNGSYDGWTYYVGDSFAGDPPSPVTPSAAPEPSSLCVLVLGAAGLMLLVRRRMCGAVAR